MMMIGLDSSRFEVRISERGSCSNELVLLVSDHDVDVSCDSIV